MAGLAAVHLSADDALCVLNGDPSLAVLHEGDDPYDSKEDKYPKNNEYEILGLTGSCLACTEAHVPERAQIADSCGKSCDNTRKQQDRDTVSDTVFVDLLTEPHHQRGTRGEHKHYDYRREYHREAFVVNGDVLAVILAALGGAYGVLEIEEVSRTLNKSQRDCYVSRYCADLASACLAFLCKTLKRGDSDAEQLDDN